jgi:hypothetical protein
MQSPDQKPPTRRRKVSLPAAERDIWFRKDIECRWDISSPTFWRYRKKKLIPEPDRKIGLRNAWSRDLIIAAERIASNSPPAPTPTDSRRPG